jgi:hypothetical protein
VKQVTALAPGWLDVTVLVGRLTGDALPQTMDMTHELTASSKARISGCSLSGDEAPGHRSRASELPRSRISKCGLCLW